MLVNGGSDGGQGLSGSGSGPEDLTDVRQTRYDPLLLPAPGEAAGEVSNTEAARFTVRKTLVEDERSRRRRLPSTILDRPLPSLTDLY